MTIAHYHLPGLFAFYELYCRFLPLYRNHPEYFYDWCDIGSIYGAPADCLWGGGRVGSGEANARDVLALMRDYGISPRLTFSNSLLRAEHLRDARCNALCRMLNDGGNGGVILHSDLLLRYLQKTYPNLYFVSSTTKVLTSFPDLQAELERAEFRYVVPDFRLNPALEQLRTLPPEQKAELIAKNPAYGRVICRCETITEGEILDALQSEIPAVSIDGVKRRCNAGMGRCQGGFCGPRVLELISKTLGIDPLDVLQDKAGTNVLLCETKTGRGCNHG